MKKKNFLVLICIIGLMSLYTACGKNVNETKNIPQGDATITTTESTEEQQEMTSEMKKENDRLIEQALKKPIVKDKGQ